jgi:hypothetical protein
MKASLKPPQSQGSCVGSATDLLSVPSLDRWDPTVNPNKLNLPKNSNALAGPEDLVLVGLIRVIAVSPRRVILLELGIYLPLSAGLYMQIIGWAY